MAPRGFGSGDFFVSKVQEGMASISINADRYWKL